MAREWTKIPQKNKRRTMESVTLFLILVMAFGFLGLVIFKYRQYLKIWMHTNDPTVTAWRPSRETILKRHIEDANAELTEIERAKIEEGEK